MEIEIDYQVDNPTSEDDELHAVLTARLTPIDLRTANTVIDDNLFRRFWHDGVRERSSEDEVPTSVPRKFSEVLHIWADVFAAIENTQPVVPTPISQVDSLSGRLAESGRPLSEQAGRD